ncbi:MAG: long-chain fatty acid--CoA ligase [Spirochaetes bacterium]|nr:MAG: long-chain fatty acid--CoA ligase [Spirochaetota bacterium]
MTKRALYSEKPWLAHYDKGVPAAVNYRDETLVDFLDYAAKNFTDRDAFISQGYAMTFGALRDAAYRFAACLADFGVKKGDSVALHLPNLIQTVAAYYGILKIGARAVMNNPLYSAGELEYQFNDSESKVLVTLDLFANGMIDLRPKTGIRQIVYVSLKDYLPPDADPSKVFAADPKEAENLYRWTDIMKKYSPTPPTVPISMDDIAMLQYTGGTTGVSKAAVLTHANLSKQIQQIDAWDTSIERGAVCKITGFLPFFHVYGLSTVMNLTVYYGFTCCLSGRPTPEVIYDILKKYRPEIVAMVPTMFIGLLQHPEFDALDLSFVKRIVSGSAPLPVEVFNEFANRSGAKISEGFGMTEASPVTHANPFDGIQKTGSIGLPYPDTECRIVDLDTGEKEVPAGEPGELIIRGPQVMQGYWKKPEETKNTIRNGWLFTGDIATMDDEGYFYIVDRKKDMILSGGYNVYPRDIDEVLFAHPKVMEACSIGVPHPSRGEQIKAFVVLKEGESATEKEIVDYCATKLATYKLPTHVEFRKELPKSTVGKILRKELRAEELRKGHTA